MAQVFKSRVDTWLAVLILLSMGLCIYGAGYAILEGELLGNLVALFMIGTGVLLPLWLLLTTRYSVSDDDLDIRCGPFRWQIRRDTITSIKPSNNPLSSPALSLDRLRIRYDGGRYVLVSPRDKAGFIRALGFEPEA